MIILFKFKNETKVKPLLNIVSGILSKKNCISNVHVLYFSLYDAILGMICMHVLLRTAPI